MFSTSLGQASGGSNSAGPLLGSKTLTLTVMRKIRRYLPPALAVLQDCSRPLLQRSSTTWWRAVTNHVAQQTRIRDISFAALKLHIPPQNSSLGIYYVLGYSR